MRYDRTIFVKGDLALGVSAIARVRILLSALIGFAVWCLVEARHPPGRVVDGSIRGVVIVQPCRGYAFVFGNTLAGSLAVVVSAGNAI